MGHKVRGRQAKKERKSKHAHHKHSSSEEKHMDHELESVHENKPEEEHNNNGIILSKVEQVDLSLLNDEGPFFEIDLKEEQMPFFGLLNSEQAAYFRQAESTLNLDTFETPDIKLTFIQSIFDEAKGNSLKLATNQICSKLMERIIMLSNEDQMKQLYMECRGFFYQLFIHKYASHVMEAFLVRAASFIEKEMLKGMTRITKNLKMRKKYFDGRDPGKELPSSIESNSLLRSKKSKIARKMVELEDTEDYKRSFQIPSSFEQALSLIVEIMVRTETKESLRETAIDPIASPVVQLIIELEGKANRNRPFWTLTFERADEPTNEKEKSFVEYLLSDPVGSHFLQTAISNQKMRNINRLYHLYMEDRVVKLAKRETTGSFVIQTLLEKLRAKDQTKIMDQLVPVLNELIVNNIGMGSSIVECSRRNNGYLKDEIVKKLFDFFNKDINGVKTDDDQFMMNILQLRKSTLYSTKDDWPTSEERRRAMFLEELIDFDDHILKYCLKVHVTASRRTKTKRSKYNKNDDKESGKDTEGTIKMQEKDIENAQESNSNMLIELCEHGVFSHIVEECLINQRRVSKIERRRILNALTPHVVELACDAQGSHIVDKLFPFTIFLNMYKERIASKLLNNEELVKRTVYGKKVWKNWKMDVYARHFGDWKRMVKQEEIDQAGEDGSHLNHSNRDNGYQHSTGIKKRRIN
ncbi:hypothetical protein HII12_000231 [Brettanomyces bruxellensis]|uniref:Nucleolar protein 9 n=1 Tax=Dekkera bruxellensis TaxID=5007 RepID=A0A8H6BQM2_DEKBR|nr:hypothetical protein HII12_000231 [Brettanomyces bruxellensis]